MHHFVNIGIDGCVCECVIDVRVWGRYECVWMCVKYRGVNMGIDVCVCECVVDVRVGDRYVCLCECVTCTGNMHVFV